MASSSIARCIRVATLVLGLAVSSAAGQDESGEAKDEVLGGKLLVKLPYEIYRTPLFFATRQGPRLGVWVHESNPAPAFGFPGAPVANPARPDPKQKGNTAPLQTGPPFELFIWDVADAKELYHLKEKDAPPAYPPAGPMMFRAREPIHRIDYTPSGNNLISVQESANGIRIQLYDPQTHKWRSLPVKLLDPVTGRVLRQTDGHRYVLSHDGRYAARLTQVSPLDKTKMSVELWTVDCDR